MARAGGRLLFEPARDEADVPELLARVPQCHRALFDGLPADTARGVLAYFFTTPREPDRPRNLRTRVLGLYDPFADRARFPAGVRLSCNVYSGCAHGCRYCYIQNYVVRPHEPRAKQRYLAAVDRDLAALRECELPPLPLHIGQSTDAMQEGLEGEYQHGLETLRRVAANRELFSAVTVLTRNPGRLIRPEYLEALRAAGDAIVQVSASIIRPEALRFYEPGAPPGVARLEAVQRLREAGVTVGLRIDPLFPHSPLPRRFFGRESVEDYGVPEAHSADDLRRLVEFAAEVGCQVVVTSVVKIPAGRYCSREFGGAMRELFGDPWGGTPRGRSFAWRLPEEYCEELVGEMRELCSEAGIVCQHCMENLFANGGGSRTDPLRQGGQ